MSTDYGRNFGYKSSNFGSNAKGHDLKIYGDTTGKYVFWDASADTLYVTGTLSVDGAIAADDIAFADSELLYFGTGNDVSITWDGTNLIVAAAADDSLIEIGDSAATQKSFDLKWYGNEANGTSYLYADASANLIYTTGVDLQLKDSDYLVFGSGAGATGDINFTWDATDFHMNSVAAASTWNIGAAGNVINTIQHGTFQVGVNDTGYDVAFNGATTGKSWLWDESEDRMYVHGSSQFNGAINVGVNDTGYDLKLFGADAGYYWLWDESGDLMDINGFMKISVGVGGAGAVSDAAGLYKFISLGTNQSTNNCILSVLEEDTETDTYMMRLKSGNAVFADATDRFYVKTNGHVYISTAFGMSVTPAVQQAHIADTAGGGTVDAEARTAINSILAALETFGFLATS
jgi:hypothetical protein